MLRKSLKTNMQKKWQQGVALLFALGILGLLLVMALGFATNSIFDQMIATNSGNSSAAKTIAQSGLERVRNMIQNYAEKMRDIGSPYNLMDDGIYGYSHSDDPAVFAPDTTNAGNSNAKSDKLKDFFSGYLKGPSSDWDTKNMGNNVNWIYLKADGRLTGRMAYIILNRADLDPGKLVKLDLDESASPATEVRLGLEANEINLRSINNELADTVKIGSTVAENFNYSTNTTNPGKFNSYWIDLPFLFDQFDLTDLTDTSVPSLRKRFTRWFICNSKNSPEAYWIDKNGDNKMTSDEQLNRFNLARTDWSTINTKAQIYNMLLLDSSYSGTPDIDIFVPPNPAAPDNPAYGNLWNDKSFDGKGIPWLALFGYKIDGTLDTALGATFGNSIAGVIARRNQIVANLVDYCQPITVSATSDSTDWFTIPPTFTGNKKTPYIDEIGVALEASATYNYRQVSVPDDTLNVTVALNGFLLGKLIDIYSTTAWGNPFTLRVKGKISYTVNVNGVETPVPPQDFEFDLPSTLASPFNWNTGYGTCLYTFNGATLPATLTSADIDVTAGPTITTVVNGVSVYIEKAILYDATSGFKGYDYSTINKTITFAGDLLNTNATKTAQSVYFSFQTEDPRQNLNEGDWHVSTTTPKFDGSAVDSGSGVGCWGVSFSSPTYSGIVNEYGSPAAGYNNALTAAGGNAALCEADKETATDPANPAAAGGPLSTAFIRETPMVSPWELGFIHRGEKWQTLNLHKYDVSKANKAITVGGKIFAAGGGSYAVGDANILDQIKMNNSSQNYKIDINNEFHDPDLNRYIVLYSLFKNIKSGSIMSDTPPGIIGGTAISDSPDISNIINSIINRTGTGANYLTRAHVIDDIAAVDPILTASTKAAKDEIIGKMINLVALDSYFTVILAVQTIKDVGGPVGTPITINKKLSIAPGLTTPIVAELGKFDLVVNGTKYYYADEITSTLKVQALVHKKTDGSCEILSVNYIY